MSYLDYLLVLIGIVWFYFYHFKTLNGHMSKVGIVLYSTLKGLTLLIIPFVSFLFAVNILGLSDSNSSVWAIVAGTFLLSFGVITFLEDKKTGVIDKIIKKAKDDYDNW